MKKSATRTLLLIILGLVVVSVASCGGSESGSSDGANSAGYPGDGGTRQANLETGDADWPLFGRTVKRTHALGATGEIDPPLEQKWSFFDRVLIEFPPALKDGVAYLADHGSRLLSRQGLRGISAR